MEKIRVTKVAPIHTLKMREAHILEAENVRMRRKGEHVTGTLHLMPHHLVFSFLPEATQDSTKTPRQKEVWVTYPMISYCCLRPSPPAAPIKPLIRIRGRDFNFFALEFHDDKQARDIYDTIRSLSCKLGRLDKLQAFSYQPKSPEDQHNGWHIYDARREWKRLGISPKDTDKGWRISEINVEYKVGWLSQNVKHMLTLPRSTRRRTPPSLLCPPRSQTAYSDTPANIAPGNAYPPSYTATP
jgi:hypothetical protein